MPEWLHNGQWFKNTVVYSLYSIFSPALGLAVTVIVLMAETALTVIKQTKIKDIINILVFNFKLSNSPKKILDKFCKLNFIPLIKVSW